MKDWDETPPFGKVVWVCGAILFIGSGLWLIWAVFYLFAEVWEGKSGW